MGCGSHIFHDVGNWSSGREVEVHVNPPGDIWHFLKTFLVLTLGEVLMASGGWSLGMLQEGMVWPQMSTVPRLRSPGHWNRKKKHMYSLCHVFSL